MRLPTFVDLLRSKLLIPGLVFLGVNITFSYMFYQVNSFKMALALLGVSLLAIWNDLIFPSKSEKSLPWKQIGLIALPLLATLPGYFWFDGFYNYNFRYELATNLILIVWVAYLFRSVEKQDDLYPFLFMIGITIIYGGLWAFLEKTGFHPLEWGANPPARVKSTFGNINYFAGFLLVLIPSMLILAMPHKADQLKRSQLFKLNRENTVLFFGVVFLIAGISLFLTQTRAAWGAAGAGLLVSGFFFAYSFTTGQMRKRILIGGATCLFAGILLLLLAFLFSDYLPQNRWTLLLTIEGWAPRFAGWMPALNSIQESPLIGYGLGSSYALYFQFVDPNARLSHYEHSFNHVHSEYLEYIQEAGLIGFVLLIAVWIYLVYLLFRIIRNQTCNPFLRKLAIGVLGGFVGFHLHGLFSVAPRMMVVKLPLYTLIALTFILHRLAFQTSSWDSEKTLKERFLAFLPGFILLGFTWAIFAPWLIGQYRFIEIQKSRPSLMTVERLERLVNEYPDAYALDFLSHLQMQYKRTEQLEETVKLIDEVLPNYRELGHTKAILALFQGNPEKAIKEALEFQNEQDKYYKPTIFLLMGLALDTNDYELFKQELKLYTRHLIFLRNFYYSLDGSGVEILIKPLELPFEMISEKDSYSLIWSEDLVRRLFLAGRYVRVNKSYSKKDRDALISYLSYQFSRHPDFQLKAQAPYENEGMQEINTHMRSYFLISQEISETSSRLQKRQEAELARTPPGERPALEEKQKEQRAQVLKPMQERLAVHREYLEERTHWQAFLNKRSFANTFINEMLQIIYPAAGSRAD